MLCTMYHLSDLYYLFYPSFTPIHISIMMMRFLLNFFCALGCLWHGKEENNMIVKWNNRVISCKNVDTAELFSFFGSSNCGFMEIWLH
jgi:hypothetical protein